MLDFHNYRYQKIMHYLRKNKYKSMTNKQGQFNNSLEED